jgi:mannose-6-phosphate isomerase
VASCTRIDAGNVILEIQQNSDTTYRVYDWGRVGLDGQPRALHIRESLECLRACQAPSPRLVTADSGADVLAQCQEFTIRRVRLAAGQRLHFSARQQPRIVSVVVGELNADILLRKGDNVLVPYAADLRLEAAVATEVLITEDFCRA